jgi:hypothetical protein
MKFFNKKTGNTIELHPKQVPVIISLIRSDEYIPIISKNDDGEHWITLNGGEGKGEHILINGEGKVMAGAGGKLTGKKLNNVKSKSKNVEKHGAPIPQYPSKPSSTKEKTELSLTEKGNNSLEEINKLTKSSSYEEIKSAYDKAMDVYTELRSNRTKDENAIFWKLFDSVSQLRQKLQKIENKSVSVSALKTNESNTSFVKSSVDNIKNDLNSKFNMNFVNGISTDELNNLWRETSQLKREGKFEEAIQKEKQYQEIKSKTAGLNVRSHTPVDITKNTPAAKKQRLIVGKIADSFSDLESRGWDIKEALGRGKVAYAPAGVGKAGGHAFQENGVGYFSISHSKYYDPEYIAEQKKYNENREKAGKPKWTVGGGTDYELQATIIHEMTHALGLQSNINSPKKLGEIIQKLNREGKLTGFPNETPDMNNYTRANEFIKWKISEYATKNIKETDAELATLVTSPDYIRGTLPKELEDHVDELFMRKK